MDLYAYNIMTDEFDLEKFIEDYELPIYRLRGCRFMKYDSEIEESYTITSVEAAQVADATLSEIHWSSVRDYRHKGFKYDLYGFAIDFDLNKIHGKDRKRVKFALKKFQQLKTLNYSMFNQYVGKDVLMIHTRTGGGNRIYYQMNQLKSHPLYLNDCDDLCDSTYADIYIDISNINLEKYFKKKGDSKNNV